jgi:uncharacterized membrane protein YfhO
VTPSDQVEVESVLLNRPHERVFTLKLDSDRLVLINVAAFAGWKATVNGQPVELGVTDKGLLSLSLTPGEYRISLRLTETPIRQLGNLITVMSATILLAGVLYGEKKRRLE